jgi:hypothetical protein
MTTVLGRTITLVLAVMAFCAPVLAQAPPTTVVTAHALGGSGVGGASDEFYIPGGVIELNVTLTQDGTDPVTALRYRLTLPAGLRYTGLGGANPPQLLPLGNTGTLDFLYTSVPALPASFRISIALPASPSGAYTFTGRGNYGVGGGPVVLGNLVTNQLKRDTVPPVISLLGSSRITINCQTGLSDPGATAFDNAEGDISDRIVVTGAINQNVPGSYTRTYSLTDASGNVAAARQRTVVVLNNCPTGEGEGEGEGPCDGNCVGAPKTDTDGDGLTDCEESCITGTLPNFADSDLDGMDDKFESDFSPPLDPTRNDAALDGDSDGINNLTEYQRGADPSDSNDPQLVVFVSALEGDDASGDGTRQAPWASIGFAISQAAIDATADFPARVIVLGGVYPENVVMAPFVNISGELLNAGGAVVAPVIQGSVQGADHTEIASLTIDGAGAGVLLDARGVEGLDLKVSSVVFRNGGVGLLTEGLRGSETIIEKCRFNLVEVGVEIRGAIPALRRSFFGDISAPAGETATGIYVRATTLTLPEVGTIGDAADPTVGYNQFNINTIAGPAVINERGTVLKMEKNDWKSNDGDTIGAAIVGPADFEPFLGAGSAILAAAVFCTVIDGATQERVTDASVQLAISAFGPVTQNADGVYGFPAVSDGSYTLTVNAEGFQTAVRSVFVKPQELVGVVVALGTPAPDDGGCNGNQQTAKLRDKAGDLLVAGMALAAMVATRRFMRRG